MKGLAGTLTRVLREVDLKGLAARLLENVALNELGGRVASRWKELPDDERERIAREVAHLAGVMQSSESLPIAACAVGDSVASLIREIRNGVNE